MRALNSILLSTISIAALTATPAFAQTPAPVDTTPEKTAEGEATPPTSAPTNAQGATAATPQGGIVVTGSRIRRNNFNTPQNIDVITRDDAVLAGTRSTTDALQSGTVTSGTSQISGSFLGFLSDNGQAANTVGLRGLGSSRTLVLLNGRRLAPAGVGPQLVAADLNVLPTSIVQRIEVLREGASSIYGSDAIAGVINIITDTSINGITIDAFTDHPIYAQSGDSRRISLTAGKTFSRGHITGAIEVRDDEGMTLGDRKDTSCPREGIKIDGVEVGQTVPGGTELRCFPFARTGGGVASGYGFAANLTRFYPNFFPGQGPVPSRVTFPGYATGNPDIFGIPVGFTGTQLNQRPESSPVLLDQTVFSPIRTYTGYVNGSYELGVLGDAELYGEGLFTRRKSHQDGIDRIDFTSGADPYSAQVYGGDYFGIPVEEFGFPVSPFFPVAFANAGINYFEPLIVPNSTQRRKQRVDFWRANAGLRGNVGLGDWRYDGNIQISRTKGRDDRQTETAQRLSDIYVAVLAPSGTPSQYTVTAIPGEVGAGNTYTCAANVNESGAYNGNTCVPLNFGDPAVLINGQLPQALTDYLYPYANYARTKYRQNTFSLGFDGSLFTLPGGEVKAAFGVEHRYDFIDDVPGAERANNELAYYGAALETTGSDKVNEAYAEIDLPIFRDRPFFNLLELEGSARYTHYQSYGSGWTYHVNAQWAPDAALRFRGNYGTNFRAPNLYEQFVADQIGYYGEEAYDPCASFGTRLSPGNQVYENCLAELTPILGAAGALAFEPNGGSIAVTTQGGRGVVKAEKAKTYGFGAVFTAPRSFADFSLAVDYWHIAVNGEVGTLGNNILNFCYQAADFPNNPYCAFIGPRSHPGDPGVRPDQAGSLTAFDNPYLNIAQQIAAGIDFDARFAARFFGGRFQTQLQATRNLAQKTEYFPGQGLTEYNGTLGYPGNGAGPHWVGSLDSRFTTGNNITFHWGVKYVGPSSSTPNVLNLRTLPDGNLTGCALGTAGCSAVEYDLKAGRYFEHGASVQFLWRNLGQFTVGVNNVFNVKPPKISDDDQGYPRIGNFFANGPYDYRGRSIFANVTKSF
jgi:outer membrane receptor protein involved in Fe transport